MNFSLSNVLTLSDEVVVANSFIIHLILVNCLILPLLIELLPIA